MRAAAGSWTARCPGAGASTCSVSDFTDLLRHITGSEIVSTRAARQYPDGATTEDYGVLHLETVDGTTATVEIGWTFPDGPVKRYVNYTAAGDGGHIAGDTPGGGGPHPPGRGTPPPTADGG